ncbi:hypothetical protein Tco_1025614 [Tanacetum coccineum]
MINGYEEGHALIIRWTGMALSRMALRIRAHAVFPESSVVSREFLATISTSTPSSSLTITRNSTMEENLKKLIAKTVRSSIQSFMADFNKRKKNFNPSFLCSSKNDDSKERVGNNVELRNLNVSWKDGVECEEIELRVSEMGDNSKCVSVLDDFCDDKVCYNAGKGNDSKSNEMSEVEVNCVMSVDEFFGYDGKKEDLESLDGNREEEDCNIDEMESHGVTDVTGGWIGGGELCKEDGKGDESKGSEYPSFEEKYDGWFENQIEAPKVSGYNLDKLKIDNGYVMCGNRGMSKVAWKLLVKMRMNGGIMRGNSGDAYYVVIGINDFVFSENVRGGKHVFEDKAWSNTDKHDEDTMESRVGINGNIADNLGIKEKGKDKDMESSGLMHNRVMSCDDGTNVSLSMNGNSVCVGMDDELVEECLSCMQMEADKPLVEKLKKVLRRMEMKERL